MIGALAPLTAPFWLGARALGGLTLGKIRHLDPALETPTAARLVAGERDGGAAATLRGLRRRQS